MSAKHTMTSRVTCGRSWLFVPGHRPERFEKAGAGLI
jgi:hypothetical protein